MTIAVLGGAMLLLYMRTERGALARDKLLLKVPIVGSVLLQSNMFGLTSTFTALIDAGVPTVEALRLSVDGVGNRVLQGAVGDVTRLASEGGGLGQAFQQHGAFPPLLAQGHSPRGEDGRTTYLGSFMALAEYYEQEN